MTDQEKEYNAISDPVKGKQLKRERERAALVFLLAMAAGAAIVAYFG